MKYLPPELIDWYFPFNWDVEELWQLEGELETKEVVNLEWHLDQPFWSSESGKGMLFDLNPREVLINPHKYPFQRRRIYEADIAYPIYMTTYLDREIIIDGIHRLAKAVETKLKTISVKFINENSIQKIAKYA